MVGWPHRLRSVAGNGKRVLCVSTTGLTPLLSPMASGVQDKQRAGRGAMAQAHNTTSALVAKLQQFLSDDKYTDMVIRVRIEKSDPERYTDIKAHAVVLAACSPYCDKALSGEWVEAAERRMELTVKDEQELEDLQLLIKLSYADSSTHGDDGKLLSLATRLRLAARADGLEFVEAVDQLVASVPLGLDFEGALTCLNELPPQLETHSGMSAARRGMVGVLAKGIEEREGKTDEESIKALKAGMEALAKCLGPVAGMFEEATRLSDGTLPLRKDVKQLPPCVLVRLLASEALQLQLENETYALLVAWLRQSPYVLNDSGQLALFKELAPLPRYHHMTKDYLASIVCTCSLMQESRMLPLVVHSLAAQRDASPLLWNETPGKRDRGVGASSASWELKTIYTLEDLLAEASKWWGPVAGYTVLLRMRLPTERGKPLGVEMKLYVPNAAIVDRSPMAGVTLKYSIQFSFSDPHTRLPLEIKATLSLVKD